MWYKTLAARMHRCGWTITDESHETEPCQHGRLVPHYVEFSDNVGNTVTITATSNKNGTPGKITKMWINGARCDL